MFCIEAFQNMIDAILNYWKYNVVRLEEVDDSSTLVLMDAFRARITFARRWCIYMGKFFWNIISILFKQTAGKGWHYWAWTRSTCGVAFQLITDLGLITWLWRLIPASNTVYVYWTNKAVVLQILYCNWWQITSWWFPGMINNNETIWLIELTVFIDMDQYMLMIHLVLVCHSCVENLINITRIIYITIPRISGHHIGLHSEG